MDTSQLGVDDDGPAGPHGPVVAAAPKQQSEICATIICRGWVSNLKTRAFSLIHETRRILGSWFYDNRTWRSPGAPIQCECMDEV